MPGTGAASAAREGAKPGTRAAEAPTRRAGRPPLSDAQKARVRLEIAMAAVRLFREHGVDGTSAAQIAEAVGISPRTLWRYCASKEECVAPLLDSGLDRLVETLRRWPADRPLAQAADDTEWFAATSAARLELTVELMRIARVEPAINAVWTRSYAEAVDPIAAVLARRFGRASAGLRVKVQAAMLVAALHQGMQDYVWRPAGEPGPSLEESLRSAARIAFAAIET
jgi:AcrR family transcriptional regulator